ncbi:MAG: hypothetical protein H5T61_13915 [Thermoflexales bacterium]|nr:hypothetical protein [Thermoflexales bacterium]
MPEHAEQPQNTFVVRFWWERHGVDSDQTMDWRGRIEHVQSGEGVAFREVRELLAFIERFVAPLSSPPDEGVQAIRKEGEAR